MADKPLIFISCGQYTDEEKSLGNEIERFIREETPFEAYFAEQQHTLEGLVSHILGGLNRCVGLIAVMHHRGSVSTPTGEIIRASVWIEQEIAIASFMQHTLGRDLRIAAYIQKGIEREGIRNQLLLGPVNFDDADEVLSDIKRKVPLWVSAVAPRRPANPLLLPVIKRSEADKFDTLEIKVKNVGGAMPTDARVTLLMPPATNQHAFQPGQRGVHDGWFVMERDNDFFTDQKLFHQLHPDETTRQVVIQYHYFRSAVTPGQHCEIKIRSGSAPAVEVRLTFQQLAQLEADQWYLVRGDDVSVEAPSGTAT